MQSCASQSGGEGGRREGGRERGERERERERERGSTEGARGGRQQSVMEKISTSELLGRCNLAPVNQSPSQAFTSGSQRCTYTHGRWRNQPSSRVLDLPWYVLTFQITRLLQSISAPGFAKRYQLPRCQQHASQVRRDE